MAPPEPTNPLLLHYEKADPEHIEAPHDNPFPSMDSTSPTDLSPSSQTLAYNFEKVLSIGKLSLEIDESSSSDSPTDMVAKATNKSTWSSRARQLDEKLGTRLGTLALLPYEIREQIYQAVVHNFHYHHGRQWPSRGAYFAWRVAIITHWDTLCLISGHIGSLFYGMTILRFLRTVCA